MIVDKKKYLALVLAAATLSVLTGLAVAKGALTLPAASVTFLAIADANNSACK